MSALFSKKEDQKKKNPKPARKSGVVKEVTDPQVKHEHDAVEAAEPEVRKAVLPKGEDSEAYRSVLSPHVTEKATNGNIFNKYTFKVAGSTNKIEVKKAIEKLYKVKVEAVNIQNMPSKSRQVGRYMGTKSGFKKATVTLKEGQKIEVV